MTVVDIGEGPANAEWVEFTKRHTGNPFLQCDPLYALSEPLLEAIRAEVPTFFGSGQEDFERDLARTASFGFFHGRALGETESDRRADPDTGLSFQERHERSRRALDDLLAEEMRRDGVSEDDIADYFEQGRNKRAAIDNRKDAFVGWLIANPGFRAEVAALRARWETLVGQLGRFPVYPHWPLFDDHSGTDAPNGFREDCARFYRRWGLERMRTWDWPVAMEPDFAIGMRQDYHLLSEAGIVLFVPWYLLRGESLNLQSVAQRARTDCEAAHLRDWVHKPSRSRTDEMGDIRYERSLWIYRYHELVLGRRYGCACQGNVQRLDQALAQVIGRDVDTIKKIRLDLGGRFVGVDDSLRCLPIPDASVETALSRSDYFLGQRRSSERNAGTS